MVIESKLSYAVMIGGMAEWTMALVLKTSKPQGFVGSNPTPSAIYLDHFTL